MMIKRNIFAILTALAATTLLAAGCGGDVECGKGTSEKDGKCVAKAAAETCGAGTVLTDGKCVLDNSGCGAGTTLEDGACVASEDSCGEGTTLDTATGQCISNSNIECGTGTVDVDGKCQPAADSCAAGTKLENGKCIVAPAACGAGTAVDANTGICAPAAEACGEGLGFTDGKCVPTEELCDAGTSFNEDTGLCLADATCKIGDEIVDGICLSPAEALFNHPEAQSIDGSPEITLPAVDERVIFTGTIAKPVEEADGTFTNDVDKFTFAGEAGQYVKLTLQALNAVDLVFEVEGPEGINEVEYIRSSSFGVEVVPARYVYIPYTGEYTVSVQPVMGAIFDINADGGEGFEFAGTLEQLEAPTPAELTLDKENAAELTGNSRNLLSNLYKFDGTVDGDLVTFTVDDFGVDAASSILVLSNDTPPAVLAEHTDLAKGQTFGVAGHNNGFQILVDNNLVIGQKTGFDISGLITGVIENVILDEDESTAMTAVANENTILKITFDGTPGDRLAMDIRDADDNKIGDASSLTAGVAHYVFFAPGGEVTLNLTNSGNGQPIGGDVSISFITPRDMGAAVANDIKAMHVPSHKVNEEIFLLVRTAPNQILDIQLDTGRDYDETQDQEFLNDILSAQIWNEDGTVVTTHPNVPGLIGPGNPIITSSEGGQIMALRLSHVEDSTISFGGTERNHPYDRIGYDITFDSADPTGFIDEATPFSGTANENVASPQLYHAVTVENDVSIELTIAHTAGTGKLAFGLYQNGNEIIERAGYAAGSTITNRVVLKAGKTYILSVGSGFTTPEDYDYTVSLNNPVAVTPSSGTNHSFATADVITDLSKVIIGSATESANLPYEHFKYTATEDGRLKVTGTILSGPSETEMLAIAYEEDTVTEIDLLVGVMYSGYETDSMTFEVVAGETYYIVVGGDYTTYDGAYDYTLKFELLPPPLPTQASTETNHSFDDADVVTTPLPVLLTGRSNEENVTKFEYWKISFDDATNVKLTGSGPSSVWHIGFRIYAADQSTILVDTDALGGQTQVRNFLFDANTTYYIEVGGGGEGDYNYSYELALEEI